MCWSFLRNLFRGLGASGFITELKPWDLLSVYCNSYYTMRSRWSSKFKVWPVDVYVLFEQVDLIYLVDEFRLSLQS